jgi:uncharacterized protein (TIGR00255 family)
MLYSMTGFGRAETTLKNYYVTIDIKSLNGKQLELNARLPINLKPYEIQIKNLLQKKLVRGSVDVYIGLKQYGSSKPMHVNTELAKYYFNALQQIENAVAHKAADPIAILLAMPEVVSQSTDDIQDEDYTQLENAIAQAADNLMQNRATEGASLTKHLLQILENISKLSNDVLPYETERTNKQKEKLQNLINEYAVNASLDNNRLEQELIYYLEKLDISEEKVRLAHHLNYMKEVMEEGRDQVGKKIGFVLQEIGREINTMGSKAYDAQIQKLVVQMKDELEKAKEQALNIL